MNQTLVVKMILSLIGITGIAVLGITLLTVDPGRILSRFHRATELPSTPVSVPILPTLPPESVLGKTTELTSQSPEPTQKPVTTGFSAAALYSLINAHRKEQGLSSLRVDTSLEVSSKHKLEDMNESNYWRHENKDGVVDWNIFDQSGYHYSLAGENLSFGNNSPWDVFSSWVASPQHNQQLLTPEYEDMGVAIDCSTYQAGAQQNCAVVLHLGKRI